MKQDTSSRTIAIVDDDRRVRALLGAFLAQEGFLVFQADGSASLSRMMQRNVFDLIVLDVLMPGEDGLSICMRLRAAGDLTPVIMLSARSADADRIAGLRAGADDYVGKPFNPRELCARIRAILRRRPPREMGGAPSIEDEVVSFGPFELDIGSRRLRKGNEVLSISTTQFAILKALVRHPGQALSREKLAQLAHNRRLEYFDRSLDIQVFRLRKLIEPNAKAPSYIRTVWGIGYRFMPNGAATGSR